MNQNRRLIWLVISGFLVILASWWAYQSYTVFLSQPKTTITSSQVKRVKHSTTTAKETHEKIEDADTKTLAQARLNQTKLNNTMLAGQLLIPKVGINLPIYQTPTQLTLSAGTAEYFPDRKLTSANTVLAAHNFDGAPVLLQAIERLRSGDKIITTDYQNVYVYRVLSNQLVDEHKVDVLDLPSTGRNLTLIRCEGGEGTAIRRVVTGVQTKVADYHPTEWKQTKQSETQWIEYGRTQWTNLFAGQIPWGFVIAVVGLITLISLILIWS